jgi:hypothetical protein
MKKIGAVMASLALMVVVAGVAPAGAVTKAQVKARCFRSRICPRGGQWTTLRTARRAAFLA